MEDNQIEKYNNHAKLMAEIAIAVLNGNTKIIENNNGVKELISFYLLIPYITKDCLQMPDNRCEIPKISGTFIRTIDNKEIDLENLRDSICHSFLTIEGNGNDGNNYIIFDDRAVCKNKDEHDKLVEHGKIYKISVRYCHEKLLEIFKEIMKQ